MECSVVTFKIPSLRICSTCIVRNTFFETDILLDRILKPTMLSSTPRLFDRLYTEYQKRISIAQATNQHVDQDVLLSQVAQFLGGRMKSITVGGAATSDAVLDFMKKCFKCAINNGYASTEAGAIAWISSDIVQDKSIMDGVKVKLVDVPELNYYTKDNRGEIWIKSETLIPGYYRNEEKNRESFKDGWYMSGDIGEMDPKTGKLKIIDRKKAIFKLSQGEYIAPTVLENMYLKSEYIDQICVHGDSFRNFCIAVIVPNEGTIRSWAHTQHKLHEDQFQDLIKHQQVYDLIIGDLLKIGQENKKQSYEIPRGIVLDAQKFTETNGLLTGSGKLCRHKISKNYADQFDKLYEKVENSISQSYLQQAIQEALGVSNVGSDKSFVDLGGDSLAASKISTLLEKQGIKITPAQLLQKDVSLNSLEKMVQQGTPNVTLNLEEEVNNLLLKIQPCTSSQPINSVELTQNVLLTGATGFLGSHLIQSILQQCKSTRLICLVRAKDEKTAHLRIMQSIETMGIVLSSPADWQRIICIPGDLSKPQLGLSHEMWEQLATQVDCIFHNGANVNFQQSYEQLKPENVLSLVELLNLSVTLKIKPLYYVSTMSIFGYCNRSCSENEPLLNPESIANFSLMTGYPQTKLVSEILLEQLAVQKNYHHLASFRTFMIGGSSQSGAMNTIDWIYRLLAGCIQAGIVPESPQSNIIMTTVDYVSDAMAYMTLASDQVRDMTLTRRAFNMTNYTSQQPSYLNINFMFTAAAQCGYTLKPLPAQEWYKQMEQRFLQGEKNPLFAILKMFSQGILPNRPADFESSWNNTRTVLAKSQVTCPMIDFQLVRLWIKWLEKQNLISNLAEQPQSVPIPVVATKIHQPHAETNIVRDGDW